MTAFQALKNPLLLAGREIVFAGVSVIASSTVASSGYHYVKNQIDPERRDFQTLIKINAGMEAINAALSIVVYAGLSKLTLQPGAKLYPLLSKRPPLPIHQTIAVASVAFMLSPIASVSFSLACAPLIELCHNVAENLCGPQKGNEIGPNIKDRTSSDVAAASVEQVPPPRDRPLQVSSGTKMGPVVEAEVPGFVTVFCPLTEEIFFRGQLFGRLVPNIGYIPAALTSSVLFGVLHGGDEGVYFPIKEAVAGLAFSLLYFRTGRLLVPFALHSGNNVFAALGSAVSSCPMTLADKHFCANHPEGCAVNPPELSFWERFVAKNWSSLNVCLVELVSTFNVKAASDDASFLPLDFFGTAEMASKESIFYDHQHDRLLKAPSVCNADGTPSNFTNFLTDFVVDQLFDEKDSVAVDRLIQYTFFEKRLQFFFHILATRPAHAESSGLLHLTMNSSPLELVRLKMQDLVNQGHHEYIFHECRQETGFLLLEFPLESVTRAEYMNWYKKRMADYLRLGLYAELKRELFILYCLDAGRRGDSSSIPELLSEYCDLAKAIQKQQPERFNEWVEMKKNAHKGTGHDVS